MKLCQTSAWELKYEDLSCEISRLNIYVYILLFVCVCRFFETISEEIDVKTSFESFGAAIVVVVFFSSVKTLRDEVI